MDNYNSAPLGKIWIGWIPNDAYVLKLGEDDQVVHVKVTIIDTNQVLLLSFVYGASLGSKRVRLWNVSERKSVSNRHLHLAILGDFNVVRNPTEASGGRPGLTSFIREFNAFIGQAELDDLRTVGYVVTWNSKRIGLSNIARSLDRFLVNESWLQSFQESLACIL